MSTDHRHFRSDIASSSAFLPETAPVKRLPLAPRRKRPQSFWQAFEDRALFYDCFWDADHGRVLLVGPPPHNLAPEFHTARFTASPDGDALAPEFFVSRSTMTIALSGVPSTAGGIGIDGLGHHFDLPIQPGGCAPFANRNVLITMNKDNDLDWIADWARWHTRMHGADACLVFDNGSSHYTPSALVDALRSVEGMQVVHVLSWPHKYGRKDPAVLDRPHYPHFLQVSSLGVALRRFCAHANGVLNCDIDELVGRAGNRSIFDQARQSPEGIVRLTGRWVEPAPANPEEAEIAHLACRHTHSLPMLSVCADKWAIDPARAWLQDLDATPSVHRFYDVPKARTKTAPTAPFWHFKAINTGWKENRAKRPPSRLWLKRLEELDRQAAIFETTGS